MRLRGSKAAHWRPRQVLQKDGQEAGNDVVVLGIFCGCYVLWLL